MMFFELVAVNQKTEKTVNREMFDYEAALSAANEMSRDGYIVTLKPVRTMDEEVEKAAVQKVTSKSAHSFIERTTEGLKPVTISKGELSYKVPIEMLTKNGNLKKTARKLVNAYFAAMNKTVTA